MKSFIFFACYSCLFAACKNEPAIPAATPPNPINGTWKLIAAKKIIKNDTTTSFPVANQEVIKLFTDTHFAFFKHDLSKGKDSSAIYETGAGTYVLAGTDYKERLEYCGARDWEKTNFSFKLERRQDTLIQQGFERIESLGVDQEILEIYTRISGN